MKRSLLLNLFMSLLLAWGCGAGVAHAATVGDLYRAQVPVADQGPAELKRALREGLGEVLVKVTGSSAVLSIPEILQILTGADGYVTEYGYAAYTPPGAAEASGLAMNIEFAQASVDRLVRRLKLPIWPADRPELLTWVVLDTPAEGRQFVSLEEHPEIQALLADAMKERGAPMLTPLLDLADLAVLSEEAAWNFEQEPLLQAAARYNSKNWMAVRLYQSSTGQWRGARLLTIDQSDSLRSLVADELPQLIDQLVAEAVDTLASRYAFIPQSDAEMLALTIDHVDTFADFSAVTGYLESLELVRTLLVDAVEDDRLTLRLAVEGDLALLLDTLRRDSRMTELTTTDFPEAAPGTYRFSWGRR